MKPAMFSCFAWILCGVMPVTVQGQRDFADVIAAGEKAVQAPNLPGGSIRVIHEGQVVLDQAFGKASEKSSREWKTDEVVAIASITKPITATLVAVLKEDGVLDFNDPVSTYLEGWAELKRADGSAVRSPTIAECLSHTAGFPGGTVKGLPRDSVARTTGDARQVAEEIRKAGLVAEPGRKYAYTFRGFAVVAAIVEKTTGQRYSVCLQEKLLEPLGMKETTFVPGAELAPRMPLAAGMAGNEAAIRAIVAKKREGWENPAGGLFSTSDDLAKFFQFHLDGGIVDGKQLVSPQVLQQLYVAQPGSRGYGLGFNVSSNQVIRHGGATGTSGWADLEKKIIFIGLTQAGSKNAGPFLKGTSALVTKHFSTP